MKKIHIELTIWIQIINVFCNVHLKFAHEQNDDDKIAPKLTLTSLLVNKFLHYKFANSFWIIIIIIMIISFMIERECQWIKFQLEYS